MKTTIYWTFFLTTITALLFGLKYFSWANTIENALSVINPENIHIIHETETAEGIIVFYQQFDGQDLSIAFVEKSFNRYKVAYSGVEGDISRTKSQFGFTSSYYPDVEGVFFPAYVGVIENPGIMRLTISDSEEKMTNEATIISTEKGTIWFLNMNIFPETPTEVLISAYSADGELIMRKNERIY